MITRFLAGTILALVLMMPKFAQADALDDFKNVLLGKHFLIKYSIQRDDNYRDIKRDRGVFQKTKQGAQITNPFYNFDGKIETLEAYDGNNYYYEHKLPMSYNKTTNWRCELKIDDKLFNFFKSERKGKVTYSGSLYGTSATKTALYTETESELNFELSGLRDAVNALLTVEPDLTKRVYNRAGSGTSEDGLQYFDMKADTGDANVLSAVRCYFDGDVIKKIAVAHYNTNSETNETKWMRTVIEVEEFSTNPDPKYFKLPDNFKEIKSVEENNEEVMREWNEFTRG